MITKESNSNIRTYKHSSVYTNQGKVDKIVSLSKEYKKYYNYSVKTMIQNFYRISSIPSKPIRYTIDTKLSQRYKSVAELQAIGQCNSYISNLKNRISEFISNSSIDDNTKVVMHYINRSGEWFNNDFKIKGKDIPLDVFRIIRSIFKHLNVAKYPLMKNVCMILNSDVCSVQQSNNSFDYWLKISTLEKRNTVKIPIKSYQYFQLKDGLIKNVVQIKINNECIESFGLMKDIPTQSNSNTNEIGIDVGLVNLITTSKGNIFGQSLYSKVQKYDKIISHKVKNANKQGLKTTKRIQSLYTKLRSLIVNEVGRCLNRMLKIEQPKTIVIENISSLSKKKASNKFSKRMNRILNQAGMKQIHRRLKNKTDILGIKLVEINPAYTSQQCSKCGFVHNDNRKSQKHFKCQYCGYTANADFNGAVNIFNRCSIDSIDRYTKHHKIKDILMNNFNTKHPSTITPITGRL